MMKRFILFLFLVLPAILLQAQKNGSNNGHTSTVIPVPGTLDKAEAAGWENGSTWMSQHEDINRFGKNIIRT